MNELFESPSDQPMTHDMKLSYIQMSAGLCNFNISIAELDLLISMYELVMEKKGETDVRSMVKVKIAVENRAAERVVQKEMRDQQAKEKARESQTT